MLALKHNCSDKSCISYNFVNPRNTVLPESNPEEEGLGSTGSDILVTVDGGSILYQV
jgi:hypothetical protein